MTLGQNIQNARRAQGLSQEALAEKRFYNKCWGQVKNLTP